MGDCNVDAFDLQRAIIEDRLQMYDSVKTKSTHLHGSLSDRVNILKRFTMEFKISSDVHNVYFTDDDALKFYFKWRSFYFECYDFRLK